MTEQRRRSPLMNFIPKDEPQGEVPEVKKTSEVTSQQKKPSDWKYETFRLRVDSIAKMEDLLYQRQCKDPLYTKQELYDEVVQFFLSAQGDIPPMPASARERFDRQKEARGRKPKSA